MALFPEPATPGLILGFTVAATLVATLLIGLVVRSWPRKGG